MNINEHVFQDDYIPCTFKLFLRKKFLRNEVTRVSITSFFLDMNLNIQLWGYYSVNQFTAISRYNL